MFLSSRSARLATTATRNSYRITAYRLFSSVSGYGNAFRYEAVIGHSKHRSISAAGITSLNQNLRRYSSNKRDDDNNNDDKPKKKDEEVVNTR